MVAGALGFNVMLTDQRDSIDIAQRNVDANQALLASRVVVQPLECTKQFSFFFYVEVCRCRSHFIFDMYCEKKGVKKSIYCCHRLASICCWAANCYIRTTKAFTKNYATQLRNCPTKTLVWRFTLLFLVLMF